MTESRRRNLSLFIIAISFLWLLPLLNGSWNASGLVNILCFTLFISYGVVRLITSGRRRRAIECSTPEDISAGIKQLTHLLTTGRPDRAELLHQRAMLRISGQQWQEAIDDFTESLSAGSKKPYEAFRYQGTALVRLERFEEALQALMVPVSAYATSRRPDELKGLGESLAERAECYMAMGDIDLAEHDLRKAIPLLDGDYLISSRLLLGSILEKRSQWPEALAEYDTALNQTATIAENLTEIAGIQAARGRTLHSMEHFAEAVAALDVAISGMSVTEGFAEELRCVRLTKADALLHCGELAKATAEIETLLQADPGDSHARVIRALIAAERQQFRCAVEELQDVLKHEPHNLAALQNYAVLLAGAHDDSLRNGVEALKVAETLASQLGSEHWFLLSAKAAAYAELGDFQEAVRFAELSLEAAPEQQKPVRVHRLEQFKQHRPFRCERLSEQK
ncbi:MAG: hypothetical protein R3C17_07655 [Planctomycetaceae bacterium]